MYYNKLIKKKKLIKFWIFLGGDFKSVFRLNYNILNFLYQKYAFVSIEKILISLKKLVPLTLGLKTSSSNICFVGTKSLFSKTIGSINSISIAKKIFFRKAGIFTNFSICSFNVFTDLDFWRNPSLLIFFYLSEKDRLLLESKKKYIPTIGFTSLTKSKGLLDYAVPVNSSYFYTVYFFSKILFKLLLLKSL